MHSTEPRTIWWDEGLWLIDQTQLPEKYISLKIESIRQLVAAIKSLSVRGAPALGAAGAYSIALAAERSHASNAFDMIAELEVAADMIRSSRPTAINLSWGVERALREASEGESIDEIRERALRSAEEIAEEDIRINHAIGRNGAKLLEDGETILTHCNAGRLACVGWGTALGVVRSAAELGKRIQVFACETRPLHQGSRLTAWELKEDGIPVTLICESMSGSLMRKARIDKVIVGADRITRDAVFNKIGTYNHAVLAKHHKIPFYVAAPLSTFDRMNGEEEIIIEERDPEEICTLGGVRLAPLGVDVYNPAFDATPLDLVSALITEKGVFRPPLMPPI
ncbi:MAG TPA: S-methyl-5-thioribose-1-phosphate isomerase [Methanothrix sp.]|uniref:S-methyl-5-thioribose-1-phosphate isomerase n=1 Tax=Methanothrix sp. TaxID=90426 RepID=UPI002CF8CAE7|nr:S-methyl-5-thioribose-1-phosphate isomerase [Methanothrix sp.]MDI9418473.1 S-methyl-5-thioribose-1-phosphate isomerase [Euryarchaeota archaeon]HON36666.1 S-methyl-5-thioribose-1-phosphate isomerase [Methanothrix sp.]HRU76302.1 S-methyl-5-thioribose-1-phosphate isomerase [Methanothrix sp.]